MTFSFPLRRPEWLDEETWTAYGLLLPIIVFFVVFQYYPILKSVAISFMNYGLLLPETPWVGFENYIRQFQDPLFLSALGNTLVFVAAAVSIGVALALFFAVLVERTGRWAKVYRTHSRRYVAHGDVDDLAVALRAQRTDQLHSHLLWHGGAALAPQRVAGPARADRTHDLEEPWF
jgi:ABC-type phosphate/phosphonate transport system permease subunit